MKRGRKDVFTKHNDEIMRNICDDGTDRTSRTIQGRYYQFSVLALIHHATDEHPILRKILFHDTVNQREMQKPTILEQLGRMKIQDNYDDQSVIETAVAAAAMLDGEYSVKEVSAFVRKVRMTGELLISKAVSEMLSAEDRQV